MCDCNNKDNKSQLSNDIDVPNYALTGFNPESQHIQSLQSTTPEDVLALEIKGGNLSMFSNLFKTGYSIRCTNLSLCE